MHLKNILFDLDGTLIDSRPGIQFAATLAIKLVLPEREVPDLQSKIGPPIQQIFREEFADLEPEIVSVLIRAFRFIYDNYGWRMVNSYDSVSDTLKSLVNLGINNFIVTNKPIGASNNIMKHLNINNYFTEIVCPDVKEPNFGSKSEMVTYLIEGHDLNTRNTVLIGDSSEDAQAAQVCNLPFIPVAFGYGNLSVSNPFAGQKSLKRYADLIGYIRSL